MGEDLIKRSDAVEVVYKALKTPPLRGVLTDTMLLAIALVRNISSTDKPQGKWKTEYHGNGWNDYWDYICSNCSKKYERADAVLYKANFCPNCGARMKGMDDE